MYWEIMSALGQNHANPFVASINKVTFFHFHKTGIPTLIIVRLPMLKIIL